MVTSKQTTLGPLLESRDGIHLTAYLVNRGDISDLKSQLRTAIDEAYEWLSHAMEPDDRNKFLDPLDNLLEDARIFEQMKGNIGLFRNKDLFRILNIPVDVERSCQVATSFHVKPLLRWMQTDREFLLLGLEAEAAHLYQGSQDSFKRIDTILFPDFLTKKGKERATETFVWLNEWIVDLTKSTKPLLFLAGEESLVQPLKNALRYKNTVKTPVAHSFVLADANELCLVVRKILKDEAKKNLEKTLLEFRFADEGKRARKNIFQISKAVVQGKVRKLIITDEVSIFGKIDPKTGGLAIHPFDLDHEDDCILDDLAQMVLKKGGEVVVAVREEIPEGRAILAILDDDDQSLQYEVLQERFG